MHTKFEELLLQAHRYGETVISPILVQYVRWMLEIAREQKLSRLYFLARDGHILKGLAQSICQAQGLSMDCRYLYCSRHSLRTAAYCLLSPQKIADYLVEPSLQMTVNLILDRARLTKAQKGALLAVCPLGDLDQSLNQEEFSAAFERLSACPLFWELLNARSQEAYENCMGYFAQEGLLQGEICIVDSGWSGSMQHSLRLLLQHEGVTTPIRGFYFGMYQTQKSPEDGIFHTFYFNAAGKLSDKAWFNNNLFECMLAAPHGMTVGYEKKNGRYIPVLQETRTAEELALVEQQEKGILDGLSATSGGRPSIMTHSQLAALVRRCMVYPTAEERALLSHFRFSDSSTESRLLPLVEEGRRKELNTRLFFRRLLRRLTRGRFPASYHPYVWFYSAVQSAPKILRPWYRYHEFFWECLRLSQKK